MRRGLIVGAALIALGGTWPTVAPGAKPVRLIARFAHGAQLGSSSAMYAHLAIDTRRLPSPVTEVRVLYPQGLGLITSGLGLAACKRPDSDFQAVLIRGYGLGRCPRNAILGLGSARAEIRFLDGKIIPETASVIALMGPIEQGTLRLVALIDGSHPFSAHLAYSGELRPARGAYGGAIVFHIPAIPAIADLARVALTDLALEIGSPRIVYMRHRGHRTIRYHPNGIGVPPSCPKSGFRFRVELAFQDRSHASATTTAQCPHAARVRR